MLELSLLSDLCVCFKLFSQKKFYPLNCWVKSIDLRASDSHFQITLQIIYINIYFTLCTLNKININIFVF